MFSKSVQYALKSLILIKHEGACINIDTISQKLDVPRNFTSKLLKELSKRGYIDSQKGPGGGFSTKNYERTVRQLIVDIDGQVALDKCSLGLSECSNENPCPMHVHFYPIRQKLNALMELTLSEICDNPDRTLKL